MNTARIADIQWLTVHDGPGLRTTLFLKGCPLACRWCHNPECIRFQPELIERPRRCAACGRCASACPKGAHAFEPGVGRAFQRDQCQACGQCVAACLSGALELCGQEVAPGELAERLMEDVDFHRHSNGGVTLSGGEPLAQPGFCGALLGILKREKIHTAIDTCGAVPWRSFDEVLPVTDLFLYDLKHIDPEEHRRLTGMSNELILENIRRLSGTGKPIEIRMPLIPGLNMGEAVIAETGRFLETLSSKPPVKLLPYHPYARDKYRQVGRKDSMADIASPRPAEIDRVAKQLGSFGLTVEST